MRFFFSNREICRVAQVGPLSTTYLKCIEIRNSKSVIRNQNFGLKSLLKYCADEDITFPRNCFIVNLQWSIKFEMTTHFIKKTKKK